VRLDDLDLGGCVRLDDDLIVDRYVVCRSGRPRHVSAKIREIDHDGNFHFETSFRPEALLG